MANQHSLGRAGQPRKIWLLAGAVTVGGETPRDQGWARLGWEDTSRGPLLGHFPELSLFVDFLHACLHLSPDPQLSRRLWAGQTTRVPWGLGSGELPIQNSRGPQMEGQQRGQAKSKRLRLGSGREKGHPADRETRSQEQTTVGATGPG